MDIIKLKKMDEMQSGQQFKAAVLNTIPGLENFENLMFSYFPGDLEDYHFLQFHFRNFDQKGLKRVALSYKCRSFLALLKKKKRQSDTFK